MSVSARILILACAIVVGFALVMGAVAASHGDAGGVVGFTSVILVAVGVGALVYLSEDNDRRMR